MKRKKKYGTPIVSLTLALVLCGAPELLAAQAQNPSTSATPVPAANQTPEPLPNAPSTQTPPPSNNPSQGQRQPPPAQPAQAPAGTGAAQAGPTAGGAGSRPAGMAIAPAKQHQVRSLLIKLGAIAAGGVALGTVYALSRSSPGRPPGAK